MGTTARTQEGNWPRVVVLKALSWANYNGHRHGLRRVPVWLPVTYTGEQTHIDTFMYTRHRPNSTHSTQDIPEYGHKQCRRSIYTARIQQAIKQQKGTQNNKHIRSAAKIARITRPQVPGSALWRFQRCSRVQCAVATRLLGGRYQLLECRRGMKSGE